MDWVGVYLHDAHQRFRSNITGDLDWTLSDTCKLLQGQRLCPKLIVGRQRTSTVFIRNGFSRVLSLVRPLHLRRMAGL